MIRWLLALVLVLAGAACHTGNKPEVLYKQAGTAVRRLDLGAALSLCDEGLRRQTSPNSPWFWRFLLLKTEILSSTGRAREALSLLNSPVPQSTPGIDELTARLKMNQGYARFRLSGFKDSLRYFNEAYEKAKPLNLPGLIAEIENKRGQPLVLLLRMPEAEACFRNALDAARRARDPYLETSALGNLGAARMFAHRYDEAIGFFEQMLPPARQGGYRRVQARATHNLGVCSRNLGDLDRALKFYEEAKRLYEATGEQQSLTDLLGDMGNIYASRHRHREAAACFRSAADAALRMGNFLYAAGWLNNLAVLSIESGDLDAASRYLRESLDNLKHIDADAREKASLEPLVTGARIEAAHGKFARAESQFRQAILRAERYRVPRIKIEGQARLGRLYIRKGRWDLAARQLRDVSRTIESTRSKLRRDEWKLTFQSSVVPFYQDYVHSLMERNDPEHALEAAEACRARVLAEKLELDGDARTATAAVLREKARRLDAVLLSFWISPDGSYLWVVTPGAITPF
ncbi:MAG: tetratricopeptide repeat protein, partial [Bryobacteraceae bacterium]